jgi:ubiquinone biosynthesis protein UbiJ
LAALEALLNRGIQSSAQGPAQARRLEGTALRLDVDEFPASVRGAVVGGRLLLATATRDPDAAALPADATIQGSVWSLLRLAGATGSGGLSVQVHGDAQTANLYRELLNSAQPDWEEELSKVIGDMAARRVSRLSAGAVQWLRSTRQTAAQNIAEYLEEESRLLPTRAELEELLQGVDAIREAAARVDARLRLLERRHQGGS